MADGVAVRTPNQGEGQDEERQPDSTRRDSDGDSIKEPERPTSADSL
jgi:hypothetical protein